MELLIKRESIKDKGSIELATLINLILEEINKNKDDTKNIDKEDIITTITGKLTKQEIDEAIVVEGMWYINYAINVRDNISTLKNAKPGTFFYNELEDKFMLKKRNKWVEI